MKTEEEIRGRLDEIQSKLNAIAEDKVFPGTRAVITLLAESITLEWVLGKM